MTIHEMLELKNEYSDEEFISYISLDIFNSLTKVFGKNKKLDGIELLVSIDGKKIKFRTGEML